jgi:hypothetical protein
LFLPMLAVLAAPPVLSVLAGYFAKNLLIESRLPASSCYKCNYFFSDWVPRQKVGTKGD